MNPPPPYDPRRLSASAAASSSSSSLRYPHHHESSSHNQSRYHLIAAHGSHPRPQEPHPYSHSHSHSHSSSHSHPYPHSHSHSHSHSNSHSHPYPPSPYHSSPVTHYPTSTTPLYYLPPSSRATPSESTRHIPPPSSRATPSESARHIPPPSSSMPHFYRRSEGSGSNLDPITHKHHRMVNEFSGVRSVSGSSDQRDRKRSISSSSEHRDRNMSVSGSSQYRDRNMTVSGSSDHRDSKRPRVLEKANGSAVDYRERNSRSSYDNAVKESVPRYNYRHYDQEKKEICDMDRGTPQKPSAKSRISVWNRIEDTQSSLASPSSSNRSNRASAQPVSQGNKPETEASGQSVARDKDLGTDMKTAEVNGEVTGKKKKKKVIIRKKIVKKGQLKIDDSTVSSSSPVDPIVEGTGSDGKRRVKRVLLLKRKKGVKAQGESSVCNEEIVTQIANQILSEKKSAEGSGLSPDKSVDEIESKIDDNKNRSLVLLENNLCISDGIIGTSRIETCAKGEVVGATSPNKVPDNNGVDSVREAPSDLDTTTRNGGKEITFTVGSPPLGEDCFKENKEGNVPTHEVNEMTSPRLKGSPACEDYVKDNKEGDVPIDEVNVMTSPRLKYAIEYENIETKMQVDVPREEEKQVNDSISEGKEIGNKDQEMKNYPSNNTLQLETSDESQPTSVCAVSISGLDSSIQLTPQETSSSDLVLGQYLPQTTIDFSFSESSSAQTEIKKNDVIMSSEINDNSIPEQKKDTITITKLTGSSTNDQKKDTITITKLTGSSTNGANVNKMNFNQEGIQNNEKETQKPVYQKSVSVSTVPKFPAQKPRHKTWRRETNDCVNSGSSALSQLPKPPPKRALPHNSYIRKGNSLIRSASSSTVPPKSSISTIPSPNHNPQVLDMSREAAVASSPVHKSEGEDQKGLERGLQNNNSKMVYMKSKNNQIVLNNGHSSNSQNSKSFIPLENAVSASNLNSDDNRDFVHYLSDSGMMRLIKKSIDKAPRRITKVASYPNVWTLSDTQAKRNDCASTTNNFFKSIPSILPWKRNALLKNSTRKRSMLRSSTSWLIRKLVLARRRDAVYAVSKDGFSLRKTGVLAVGGSNLKWSRSIEKNSKKACEEATLAVAEVERNKREKRKSASLRNKGKKGAKALFTASDRTGNGKRAESDLSRPSACSGYVRVNKGNQLVRNPKKLVCILASEKIQRSLHTLRNAKRKKQQYCLFYTRFGRCNKMKCTYIHDPAKIAICTKFLRGMCVDLNCKLTHQIIPERMPDCSYFLQGLCTNLSCPYRHVNVNPKAPVCEGFLRGYCADGDECRKKHSYTCPEHEEKGKCLQGPKCKLYHPKTKAKPKKWKVGFLQKSGSRPRYFESSIGTIESTNPLNNGDDLFSHGHFGDFVNLRSGKDGDGSHLSVDTFEPMKLVQSDTDCSDLEEDDELIKPIRIMGKAGLAVP